MDVTHWKTLAAFFLWPHVQRYIEGIDSTAYRLAIEFSITAIDGRNTTHVASARAAKDGFLLGQGSILFARVNGEFDPAVGPN